MPPTRLKFRTLLPFLLASGLLMSGCGFPVGGDFERLAGSSLSDHNPDANRSLRQAVNFFKERPVTLLEINDENAFRLMRDAGQEVPQVVVGRINAAPMKFGALLNQIAAQTAMNWRIEGPGKDALMAQDVYYVQRNESMLKAVLDELARLTDAFYRVEGDRIIFSQDQLFIVRVPRMADSQEILENGLVSLGATDIFRDKYSGTISFRATRPVYESARRLMSSFEQGRDMIVYDMWIIDRSISDKKAIGLSGDFTFGDGTLGVSGQQVIETILDGAGDGGLVSGNIGEVDAELALNFLRALGQAETLARPTISMLSGGESSFSTGEEREYIREIDSSTSSSGDSTSSGTETETLKTGITIDVGGSHNGGVISTKFEINIDEFIEFDEFDTGEVTLKLPHTTSRTLNAHLEARPGDVMVIGGIIRERQEDSARELAIGRIPLSSGRAGEKTETIIMVRPRLVQIRPVRGAARPASLRVGGDISEFDTPRGNAIAGVIEDEKKAAGLLERLSGSDE